MKKPFWTHKHEELIRTIDSHNFNLVSNGDARRTIVRLALDHDTSEVRRSKWNIQNKD